MRLTAYVRAGQTVKIRPAPVQRDWMDATANKFAYRCLPLGIANSHGWEILCPEDFVASWTGGNDKTAVTLAGPSQRVALSHFGFGVLTISLPCIFVTDPGVDLFVQGPMNRPKDGVSPLSAIVETDWLPFTFTMNWKLTRRDTEVRFEEGEPICHIFPIHRGSLDEINPEIRDLSSNCDLRDRNDKWIESRTQFLQRLNTEPFPTDPESWQKHYFQGIDLNHSETPIKGHRTKLNLKPFTSLLS